jgi:hypothetical protein
MCVYVCVCVRAECEPLCIRHRGITNYCPQVAVRVYRRKNRSSTNAHFKDGNCYCCCVCCIQPRQLRWALTHTGVEMGGHGMCQHCPEEYPRDSLVI